MAHRLTPAELQTLESRYEHYQMISELLADTHDESIRHLEELNEIREMLIRAQSWHLLSLLQRMESCLLTVHQLQFSVSSN